MSVALGYILICLSPVFLYLFAQLLGKIEDARKEGLIKQVEYLKNRFPYAFKQRFGDNSVKYFSRSKLQEILNEGDRQLRDIERRHEEQEFKNREEQKRVIKKLTELYSLFPHGIERFKKDRPNASDREIIQAEGDIRQYEENYIEFSQCTEWYNAQQEFSRTSRKAHIDGCGCVSFSVSLSGTGEQGEEKEYKHLIWQHFAASYCQDNTLNYTFKPSLWQYNRIVSSVESCSTRINKAVLESVFSFVKSLPKETGVLFADNPQEIPLNDFISFHYHSFIKLLNDNEIRHWRSDELGMISERDHIRNFVILDSI